MESSSDRFICEVEGHRDRLAILLRWHVKHTVDERLRPSIDQEAIIQEAMLKSLQWVRASGERYRDIRDVRRWLNRILLNLLRDRLRLQARTPGLLALLGDASSASIAVLECWIAADQTSPSRAAIRREQLQALEDARRLLPKLERRVVQYELKGLTPEQIAAKTGKTKPAIRGLLYRAKKRLARAMASIGHTSL